MMGKKAQMMGKKAQMMGKKAQMRTLDEQLRALDERMHGLNEKLNDLDQSLRDNSVILREVISYVMKRTFITAQVWIAPPKECAWRNCPTTAVYVLRRHQEQEAESSIIDGGHFCTKHARLLMGHLRLPTAREGTSAP